ncbi:3-hydroxyacyl-CoA dehydrogenase NAD-binding domain-containing protein [Umboniibacter marinipuniceus]|uniref:Short chain enoyl-CoA hydratase /3-hydroxyacyl-CoA dehydrogenase n=1 Tax=Umboniibacter marinipuniceus TaxID=569599 RepID=A0A3M0ABM6_9GAMM|nr:3-hydroxyacyl-CoA dehydrogenase NAD-binding domain-containing protein [Umboniibacter marinipuniceus]RMA80979.1 short chain enoyl-CoA hydratase /3-hydroxyacyl-CoA dehydrogenase [Umboniibacter marinipuniceus]
MSSIQIKQLENEIVQLILDNPNGSSNLMNQAFTADFIAVVETLKSTPFRGIVITSAKKTFFAGGDLSELIQVDRTTAAQSYEGVQALKLAMRWLETCGKPVVACINGAALGGGLELALHCHHRIAVTKGVSLGLPEVTLGLLPGGGGVVRLTRLLGLQAAMPYLLEGKQFKPAKALELGLVDQLVEHQDELLPQAMGFILATEGEVKQRFDQKGYRVPGGKPSHPSVAGLLPIAPAMIRLKTKGVMPAPEAILSVMVESLQVDVDAADRIESRYFVELASGAVAKNMINTFWFQLNALKSGASRPAVEQRFSCQKLGVLGAGMMGAGIAYAAASKGIQVVLNDVSDEAAEQGKAYTAKLLSNKVAKGYLSEEAATQVLAAIKATSDTKELAACDLIIEAVPEVRALKAEVTQRAIASAGEEVLFASNTSTLPITGLAKASPRADRFIGLHFFSPVNKMPLVEIIRGEHTSDETLAQAYDFVQQIAKTPIVVNDSRGFFTSRVFGTFTQEAMTMIAEGVPAAVIENAAYEAGFPVGPLAIIDEVSLTLIQKVRAQTEADMAALGDVYLTTPSDQVLDAMIEQGRCGKAAGAGFYEYSEGAKQLWGGLATTFSNQPPIPFADVKDRLLYRQALEAVRALDEGVINSVGDANIGSIMGIGFPPWTGGVLQFVNQHGLAQFVERADELAQGYGAGFSVPASLRERATDNREYQDEA